MKREQHDYISSEQIAQDVHTDIMVEQMVGGSFMIKACTRRLYTGSILSLPTTCGGCCVASCHSWGQDIAWVCVVS